MKSAILGILSVIFFLIGAIALSKAKGDMALGLIALMGVVGGMTGMFVAYLMEND